MPSTFTEAASRLGRVADTIDGPATDRALTRAGVAGRAVFDRAGVTLSGYGRGARRGRIVTRARFDQQAGHSIVFRARPGTVGEWALLESGSYKAGGEWRTPRRKGVRRKRGTVGRYQHRPVPARHLWSHAYPEVRRTVVRTYHGQYAADLRRAWGR